MNNSYHQKEPEPKEESHEGRIPGVTKLESMEKADEIALYYGFTPINPPQHGKLEPAGAKFVKELETGQANKAMTDFHQPLFEKSAVVSYYLTHELFKLSQPLMLSFSGPAGKGVKQAEKPAGSKRERQISLEIVGSTKSITEAILLKTAWSILEEEGYKDMSVDVNSAGDKDSSARFLRELGAYWRKHLSALPAACRQALKKDMFAPALCGHEKCLELFEHAPKSLSFLSEKSRTHFKEVLEYLETLGIPYMMDTSLIGSPCSFETAFRIKNSEGKVLALGMRYDGIGRKIGSKKDVPAAGITLTFEPLGEKKIKRGSSIVKKPKFYFIQLGFDAKLKSLQVVEILRQAKVPLYQSLSKDKLAGQMAIAENLKIPYAIIMGQKEAMENAVIVRQMSNRSQETVKIADLAEHISKVK